MTDDLDRTAEMLAAEIWALEVDLVHALRDEALDDGARRLEVQRLLDRARTSIEPALSLRALEWALARDLDELTEPDAGLGDPVERRLERLHGSGEHVCGRCLRPLPARETIAWWRARRMASAWRPERRSS
jgi:hypothetical protein